MISPQRGIAQPKSRFQIDGTRPSPAVPHRDLPGLEAPEDARRDVHRLRTRSGPHGMLTHSEPVVEADIRAMGEIRLMVASAPD
jgi:hypothetical protein